jgi:hypothetical protein
MSSFREQKTEIKDKAALLKTLEELGYTPQDHETKQTVRGHGYESKKAEIILKKEDLKQGGDIGFSKGADGNYQVVTDTYVMRNGFDLSKFTKEVKAKYAPTYGKMLAKKNGWKLARTITTENDQTKYVFTQA